MNSIEVKYAVANNSTHAKEPKKVMVGSQVMICLQQKERYYIHAV